MVLESAVLIDALVFATSVSAVLIAVLALRHSNHTSAMDRIQRITDRLYEIDRITIEHPDLQKLLYDEGKRAKPYFYGETERNEEYFRLKSYIYMQLNQFDEIISILHENRNLDGTADTDAWKRYILLKMAHPLFREVYDAEFDIWGHQFKSFYNSKLDEMLKASEDDRLVY